MKSTDWSKLPVAPAAATGDDEIKWVVPDKFFDELPSVFGRPTISHSPVSFGEPITNLKVHWQDARLGWRCRLALPLGLRSRHQPRTRPILKGVK
jgi:hypothetical protein